MKRFLSFILSILLLLQLPCSAAAAEGSAAEGTASKGSVSKGSAAEEYASAEDRVVLTIGDTSTRSGGRYHENMGLWRYLRIWWV